MLSGKYPPKTDRNTIKMRKAVTVTQRIEDFDPSVIERARKLFEGSGKAQPGKDAAFKTWLSRLNRKDTLPRGRFFKGKRVSGLLILDEGRHYYTR